jgi:hypothetical protein
MSLLQSMGIKNKKKDVSKKFAGLTPGFGFPKAVVK